MKFLILNGPNLGFLGQRQPDIYGKQGMEDLPQLIEKLMGQEARSIDLEFFQSNYEGELIDRIEKARQEEKDGIVLNAGAYTHTSLALADCLAWIKIPCVEVHLSNIWGRSEQIREKSLIAQNCIGVIAGFGIMSYALAVLSLVHHT